LTALVPLVLLGALFGGLWYAYEILSRLGRIQALLEECVRLLSE